MACYEVTLLIIIFTRGMKIISHNKTNNWWIYIQKNGFLLFIKGKVVIFWCCKRTDFVPLLTKDNCSCNIYSYILNKYSQTWLLEILKMRKITGKNEEDLPKMRKITTKMRKNCQKWGRFWISKEKHLFLKKSAYFFNKTFKLFITFYWIDISFKIL